tara:strand:- start:472 stop:1194 length:723 start_codon:yes stop_codon:yes gene_type:complete
MKSELKTKAYKLTRDAAPLSFMIPTRNSARTPLLYFDEEKGYNRPLRYARNQRSPFEDEQDGNAIVEPIIFEDGMLIVEKTNPTLQEFLKYHPMNGNKFIEIDDARDAQEEYDYMTTEVDALIEARSMSIDKMEIIGRVIFNKDVSLMSTAELKRDVLVFAKTNPEMFMRAVNDPSLKLQSNVQRFLITVYFHLGITSVMFTITYLIIRRGWQLFLSRQTLWSIYLSGLSLTRELKCYSS